MFVDTQAISHAFLNHHNDTRSHVTAFFLNCAMLIMHAPPRCYDRARARAVYVSYATALLRYTRILVLARSPCVRSNMAGGGVAVGTAARICALAGAVVYLNSLGLQFCFDDVAAIKENADLRSNVSWFNLLQNDFWGLPMEEKDSHKSYRPLTVATFRLNYMLHELQPLGYHLVNVLLHSAVCYLFVLLCGVVFSEVWPALIAGLLFAVHPIHTEAVRKEGGAGQS